MGPAEPSTGCAACLIGISPKLASESSHPADSDGSIASCRCGGT
jgi:hypothetical protein